MGQARTGEAGDAVGHSTLRPAVTATLSRPPTASSTHPLPPRGHVRLRLALWAGKLWVIEWAVLQNDGTKQEKRFTKKMKGLRGRGGGSKTADTHLLLQGIETLQDSLNLVSENANSRRQQALRWIRSRGVHVDCATECRGAKVRGVSLLSANVCGRCT